MSKKIIQFKYPIESRTISFEYADNMIKYLKEELGDEYVFVFYPYDIEVVDGDTKIYQIDDEKYTYNELKEIIEDSCNYKDLCN